MGNNKFDKYDIEMIESSMKDYWSKKDVIGSYISQKGGKDQYFLDGPPYASGSIHLGTAWNKILKDTYIRYLTMHDYNVTKQPGWDCHGLPIEVKVEQSLNLNSKKDIHKIGLAEFIKNCKNWANKHIDIMAKDFKHLGIWMDWDNPYVSMTNDYIESAWWTLKKASQKELLSKDFRVIFWCPRCETALAEHEVRGEYKTVEDASIYLRFKVKNQKNTYLIVWTTTPWTLPANVAVTAHPEHTYAKVKVKDELWIIAEPLVDKVMSQVGIFDYQLFDLIDGEELFKWQYIHPLFDEIPKQKEFTKNDYPYIHSVVLDEMVTVSDGTGLVHTAPGHGEEDFNIGKKYNLPVFNPVSSKGAFTEDGGEYSALDIKESNDIICKRLKEKGILLKLGKTRHSYPHCWRCKTPLIFRATKQWFLKINKIKDKLLKENKKNVTWNPHWVHDRYENGVENVGDWCISRQRYWGIPIPIWICKCGNYEVISSLDELKSKSISDIYSDIDLHKPYIDEIKIKCRCGGEMNRIPDVLDVWFDSGIASWASLGYPKDDKKFKKLWPAEFITEGHDQVTKWFYSQQAASIICFDKMPYKNVLMHGFALDSEGHKMSKSLGNAVSPNEICSKYGVDVARYYFLWATAPWEDLKFNWDEINVVNRIMNVLWNIASFINIFYSLDDFDAKKTDLKFYKGRDDLISEDRWILSKINSLQMAIEDYFSNYEFHKAMRMLQAFILDDFSRSYIKFVRRRVWQEAMSKEKLDAYNTLYYTLYKLILILAPVTVYYSEYVYQNLLKKPKDPKSIHLNKWPKVDNPLIDEKLEDNMEVVFDLVEKTASLRQKINRKLRWPILNTICIPKNENIKEALINLENLYKSQINTLNLEILDVGSKFGEIKYKIKPNFKKLGPKFKEKMQEIAKHIENMDSKSIMDKFREQKSYILNYKGTDYQLDQDDIEFIEELPENISHISSEYGDIFIDSTLTDEVIKEGITAEIVRRINDMRKDMKLDEMQKIEVAIDSKSSDVSYLKSNLDFIKNEIRANQITFEKVRPKYDYEKEWKIDKDKYRIFIKI